MMSVLTELNFSNYSFGLQCCTLAYYMEKAFTLFVDKSLPLSRFQLVTNKNYLIKHDSVPQAFRCITVRELGGLD